MGHGLPIRNYKVENLTAFFIGRYDRAAGVTALWFAVEEYSQSTGVADEAWIFPTRGDAHGLFPSGWPPHYGDADMSGLRAALRKLGTLHVGQIPAPLLANGRSFFMPGGGSQSSLI